MILYWCSIKVLLPPCLLERLLPLVRFFKWNADVSLSKIWFEGNKLSHPSMLVTYCFQSSLCLCFRVTGALLSVSILPWYWRHEKWSFTVLPINSFCWEWMFKTAPISWITSFTQWSFMRSFCVFVCKV